MKRPLSPIDLNCDLGEGEAPARTRALMRQINSANVACGGHAGSLASMERCIQLCTELNVRLGAHPGAWSQGDFGRGAVTVSPADLALLVLHQAGALQTLAQRQGQKLHHIKLHGALYHAVEADPELARHYLKTVRKHFPGVKVYARSGGRVAAMAGQLGVIVWQEIFIDRNYADSGELLPRSHPQAQITTPREAATRLVAWQRNQCIQSLEGRALRLPGQTLCLHSDHPNALQIARSVRNGLQDSV